MDIAKHQVDFKHNKVYSISIVENTFKGIFFWFDSSESFYLLVTEIFLYLRSNDFTEKNQ